MPEIGRVIGVLWATSKDPSLNGATMQLLQPLTAELDPAGDPLVAIDLAGAGPGELVLYVTAYEAVVPYHRPAPIDASIVGIIDEIDLPC